MVISKKKSRKSKKLINKKSVIAGITILLLICVVVIFVHKRTELKNPEWLVEWIKEHRENLIKLNYKNMLPEDIVFDIAKTYDMILEKKLSGDKELKVIIKEMEKLLKYAQKCDQNFPTEEIKKLNPDAINYHVKLTEYLQKFFTKQNKRFNLQYMSFSWGRVYYLGIGEIDTELTANMENFLECAEFWGHLVEQFNIDVVIGFEIPDIRRLYYYKEGYGAPIVGGHDSLGVVLDLSEAVEASKFNVSLLTDVQVTKRKIKKPNELAWELLKRSCPKIELQNLEKAIFTRAKETLISGCVHELGHAIYRKINPWQANLTLHNKKYDDIQVNELFAFLTEITYGQNPYLPLQLLTHSARHPQYELAYQFIKDRFPVSIIYNRDKFSDIDFSMVKNLEYPYDTKEKEAVFQQIYRVRPEELRAIARAWGKWLLEYLAKAMKEAE